MGGREGVWGVWGRGQAQGMSPGWSGGSRLGPTRRHGVTGQEGKDLAE